LTTEGAVNDALKDIHDGTVGFDTEYMACKPTPDELFIDEIFSSVPGSKRSGIIVWQALQFRLRSGFEIVWDNIGLCIIQLARGDDVWLLNTNRIRGEYTLNGDFKKQTSH
jgi:hypothetical protein